MFMTKITFAWIICQNSSIEDSNKDNSITEKSRLE